MRVPRQVRLAIFCVVVIGIIAGAVFGVRALLGGGGTLSGEGMRAEVAAGERAVPFMDGYLVSDGVVLRRYGNGEKMLWDYEADARAQEFSASAGLIALWCDQDLRLLDDAGLALFTTQLAGPIDMARCGNAAVAAYVPSIALARDGTTANGSIVVKGADGADLDQIDLYETETLLDFGFYSDQDLLWVLTLNVEGSAPATNLATFQPGKEQTGATPFDQIVYAVHYLDNQIFAVGTSVVSIVANNEVRTAPPMVYGWQLIDTVQPSKTDMAMLFTLSGEAANHAPERLKLLREDGTSREIQLQPGCMAAFVGAQGVWGVAPQTIYFVPFDEGKPTQEFVLSYTIAEVGPKLSQNRLMVRIGEEMRIIKLP